MMVQLQDEAPLPSGMTEAMAQALAALFEDYSDARPDYGPPPTRSDIATPRAAAIQAFAIIAAAQASPT